MIVHVLGSMGAGGNERLCLELMRRAPPGVPLALVTIDRFPRDDLEGLFKSLPRVRFFHHPYRREARARFVVELALRLRELRPSGIIIYPFGLHLLVALAAKAVPGCKVLVHAGNPPPLEGTGRRMFRRIVAASRLLNVPIWSCSETVHAQMVRLGVSMPRDSHAQPNGIDVVALRRSAEQARTARSPNGPILAMVARLDDIKDHDTLIAAFGSVMKRLPSARLWLIGDGSRRGILERQVETRGLTESVSFLGVRQEVGALLGQVDIFIFSTTRAEGFGIALAEAMAVGLPIIASDVPACREVLGNPPCGALVPPKDERVLAENILAILADPGRMRRLGVAASERAEHTYDIGACALHYYGHVLGGQPSKDG